ncbi:hypothetical protein [Ahrensia sp. R2A130]|uniref:hypothetical protein n=1 Tax=Ahrensia sp. R2A130 TaxID=744979 RepID=UPI0001E0ACB2|nr:hypothetical protein [Ahrensia sp. R2A130]EFL88673.1 putative membrane protein [Ahrensia sp. R2A130]
MPTPRTLAISLLIIRLTTGAFLFVWASLKFLRPEWMVNVFKGTYGLDWVTADYAYAVGGLQMAIVLLFLLGLFRTPVYAFITAMHATGIIGALLSGSLLFKGGLIKALSTGNFEIGYVNFPANLLWTSVATLGALVALFLLRHGDRYSIDGLRKRT